MRVTVDGTPIEVPDGATILDATRAAAGVRSRRCASTSARPPFGACRVCLVGVEGASNPLPACTTPCRDGMAIDTQDATARRVVAQGVVELVLSELPEPPAPHTELAQIATQLQRLRAALDGRDPRVPSG